MRGRRVLTGLVAALLVVGVVSSGEATPAAAAGSSPPTTESAPSGGAPGQIIPEPNSGESPDDPGDRGGWLQLGLLVVIVVGVGLIGWRIVRSARHRPAREGPHGSTD